MLGTGAGLGSDLTVAWIREEVTALIRRSYRMTAPKRLAVLIQEEA